LSKSVKTKEKEYEIIGKNLKGKGFLIVSAESMKKGRKKEEADVRNTDTQAHNHQCPVSPSVL